MTTVNLIPAPRRDARRRRRQRNTCVAVCAAYALLLGSAVGVVRLMWGVGEAGSVDDHLASADRDIDRLDRDAASARAELAIARATIEATRTVSEQPDWSILLALLAQTNGDDVVLRSISVAPAQQNAAFGAPMSGSKRPAAAGAAPDLVLDVAGIGRTPLSVSRHVLKLEDTGLFSKVELIDHNREPYLTEQAIAFRVQCTFGEPVTAPRNQTASPPGLSATDNGGIGR